MAATETQIPPGPGSCGGKGGSLRRRNPCCLLGKPWNSTLLMHLCHDGHPWVPLSTPWCCFHGRECPGIRALAFPWQGMSQDQPWGSQPCLGFPLPVLSRGCFNSRCYPNNPPFPPWEATTTPGKQSRVLCPCPHAVPAPGLALAGVFPAPLPALEVAQRSCQAFCTTPFPSSLQEGLVSQPASSPHPLRAGTSPLGGFGTEARQ